MYTFVASKYRKLPHKISRIKTPDVKYVILRQGRKNGGLYSAQESMFLKLGSSKLYATHHFVLLIQVYQGRKFAVSSILYTNFNFSISNYV